MKTIQKFIIAMLLVLVPSVMMAQDKDKNTETIKFKTSITCQNCVNTIMNNLPKEKGVKDVKCDITSKEVSVTYQKDKNNPEEIKKTIEKLGFTAKLLNDVKEKK